MRPIVLVSVVLITLALIFYTVGVWAEHARRYLLPWHVRAFWAGLAFDVAGTTAMEFIEPGFHWVSAHTISGQVALFLMLGHAVWATRVVRRNDEELRRRFHRYSLVVWAIWLIPYLGGMALGMRRTV